jgi:hypothetical protein
VSSIPIDEVAERLKNLTSPEIRELFERASKLMAVMRESAAVEYWKENQNGQEWHTYQSRPQGPTSSRPRRSAGPENPSIKSGSGNAFKKSQGQSQGGLRQKRKQME